MSSKVVENRVVSMDFDNSKFEKNTRETMGTLDKLRDKLGLLPRSAKGFEDVENASKKVTMKSLLDAIEQVNDRFSASSVIARTALENITNSAINAGKQMVNALAITPAKTGFQEYETQINAVQTILANTSSAGTTLEEVNDALDQLNKYADLTIYNFTEMTRNIGTFTAAGIDLDTSVSAIQGIANLAAVSGSTSQQASTAMYQLSQALASGTVKLMDWNSVVNAGMGGQVFQDALKETARLYGVAIDEMIEYKGSFRETLSEGWLTSQILTETLKKFTTSGVNEYLAEYTGYSEYAIEQMREIAQESGDVSYAYREMAAELAESCELTEDQIYELLNMSTTAEDAATKVKTFTQLMDTLGEAMQSGWTQTWEIIIGDFEEAKELFTTISDVFGGIIEDISNARNGFLQEVMGSPWDKLTSRLDELGIYYSDFDLTVQEVAKNHGYNMDKIIEKYGSLEYAVRNGGFRLTYEMLYESFNKLISDTAAAQNGIGGVAGSLEEYGEIVQKVINGAFGNGANRVRALTDAGYDYELVQGLVNKRLAGLEIALDDLSDAQLKNLGYTTDQIIALREMALEAKELGGDFKKGITPMLEGKSGRELMLETVVNTLTAMRNIIYNVSDAWHNVFPKRDTTIIRRILEALNKFSFFLVRVTENADVLRFSLGGLFKILSAIKNGFTAVFNKVFDKLNENIGTLNFSIADFINTGSNLLYLFADWIEQNNIVVKAFKYTWNSLQLLSGGVYLLFQKLLEVPQIKAAWDFVKPTFDSITSSVIKFRDAVKGLIEDLKDMEEVNLENIEKAFNKFLEKMGYTPGEETIVTRFKKIKETIIKTITDLALFVNNNITLADIFAIFTGATTAKVLMSILAILGNFGTVMETVTEIVEKFGKFGIKAITSFTKMMNAQALAAKSTAILNFALAIGIMAAAVAGLSYVAKYNEDGLKKATFMMVGIAGGMVLLVGVLTLLSKLGSLQSIALSMFALAVSIGVVIAAVKMLQKETKNIEFLKDAFVAGGIGVGLIALAALLKKVEPSMWQSSLSLLAIALSIKMVISALKTLNKLKDVKVSLIVETLITLFGGLSIAMLAAKGLSWQATFPILSIAISLGMLVGVIKKLAKIDRYELSEGLAAIKQFFFGFAGMLAVTKFAGRNAAKVGGFIFGVTSSMVLMLSAVRIIGSVPAADIEKATKTFSSLMGMFSLLIATTHGISAEFDSEFLSFGFDTGAGKNAHKLAAFVLAVSAALGVISIALVAISHIPTTDLQKATDSMTEIMKCLALIVAAANFQIVGKKEIKTGPLIALTVAIGIVAAALVALSFVSDGKNVIAAGTGMLIAFLGMAVLLKELEKESSISYGSLITLVLSLAAIAGIMVMLKDANPKSLIAVGITMAMILSSLAGAAFVLSKIKAVGASPLIAMAVLTAIVGGLALMFPLMNKLDADKAIPVATALSEVLLAMSGACVVLGIAGAAAPAALMGIGVLLALVAAIAIVIAGFAYVAYLVGEYVTDIETIQNGIDVIATISTGLGEALGGFIAGVLGTSSSALPEIGTNISDFMTNLQGFFDGLDKIPENAPAKTLKLTECIGLLMAEAFVNQLLDWSTFFSGGYIDNFADDMKSLGKGISGFVEAIGDGIESDKVSSAADAAAAIGTMMGSFKVNAGQLTRIFTMLDQDAIPRLGKSVKEFYNKLGTNFKADLVSDAADAIYTITNAMGNIPTKGGLLSLFTGNANEDKFIDSISRLGIAIRQFHDAIGENFDKDKVIEGADAATAIAVLESSLPGEYGVLQHFMGEFDFEAFIKNIPKFGKAMISISNVLSKGEFNEEIVSKAATCAQTLAELEAKLPGTGGILQEWFGNKNIADFGTDLLDFANSMVHYGITMKLLDTDIIENTKQAVETLITLNNSVSSGNSTNFFDFLSNVFHVGDADEGMGSLGSSLELFGVRFANFAKACVDVDTDKTSHVISNIKFFMSSIEGFTKDDASMMEAFANKLPNIGSRVKEFCTNMGDANYAAFSLTIRALGDIIDASNRISAEHIIGITTFAAALSDMAQTDISGFIDTYSDITDIALAIGNFYNALLVELASGNSDFYDAGKESAMSYKNGFSENIHVVILSIKELNNQIRMSTTVMKDWFSDLGIRCVEGFANSINSHRSLASIAATNMANSAIAAARLTLGVHSPSRVFTEIGNYTGSAFTDTLLSYAKDSESAGNRLAEGAIEGLQNSISTLMMMLESGINTDIVITPVLDLSQIQNGTQTLASMLGYYDGGSFDLASGIARGINKRNADINMEPSAIEKLMSVLGSDLAPGDTYNNTFNITGDDPKAIADEVLYVFQKQIERKGATWA